MKYFKSWRSYHSFAFNVMRKNRYVFPKEIDNFLNTVSATSENRRFRIRKGKTFWRAQHGYTLTRIQQDSQEFEVEGPRPQERMKPLRQSAREGRINPKGIPCLYLGSDKDTAMAKVRRWLGEYISVAQFKTNKNLSIVDCRIRIEESSKIHFNEPPRNTREELVWSDINRSFSQPVTSDEGIAEYAPTQILAEAFQRNGFDGILYKSLLGSGYNLAIFDIDCADILNCFLFKTSKIKFKFEQAANPYIVSR